MLSMLGPFMPAPTRFCGRLLTAPDRLTRVCPLGPRASRTAAGGWRADPPGPGQQREKSTSRKAGVGSRESGLQDGYWPDPAGGGFPKHEAFFLNTFRPAASRPLVPGGA